MVLEPSRYRARWVFAGEGPPIERGVVDVVDGRIAGVSAGDDRPCCDLGDVAVIPGLVNTHTHLEFSDLARPLPWSKPFTRWLQAVIADRRQRTLPVSRSLNLGRCEAVQSGTTLLGEIATSDLEGDQTALEPARLSQVVFREILGLRPELRQARLDIARQFLDESPAKTDGTMQDKGSIKKPQDGTSWVVKGLSPHAPYSVHPDLYADLVRLAVERRVPLAVHLAETEAELELLRSGSGEFVQFLEDAGVWVAEAIPRGTTPLDYLKLLRDVSQGLVVHSNYLNDEEQRFVAGQPNLTVVYCPRTHAYFGHQPHPWKRILARGGQVALGTDSRASNPDLSLWQELLFLRRQHPDVSPAQLLHLGTFARANALGVAEATGSLTAGKWADLAVVRMPRATASSNPSTRNPLPPESPNW